MSVHILEETDILTNLLIQKSENILFSKYCAKIHNTWPHHMPKGRIEQGQHLYSVIIEVGNPDD